MNDRTEYPTSRDPNELLPVRTVAATLHVGMTTAWNLITQGELPACRFGGNTRVRRADLDEFIESRTQRRTPVAV